MNTHCCIQAVHGQCLLQFSLSPQRNW
jgi:hypothetical protein